MPKKKKPEIDPDSIPVPDEEEEPQIKAVPIVRPPRGERAELEKLAATIDAIVSKKWQKQTVSSCHVGSCGSIRISVMFFDLKKIHHNVMQQVTKSAEKIVARFNAKVKSAYSDGNTISIIVKPEPKKAPPGTKTDTA